MRDNRHRHVRGRYLIGAGLLAACGAAAMLTGGPLWMPVVALVVAVGLVAYA